MYELIIEGYRADLAGDIAADITYSLADIRTPEKRQVNYSKTITLPGTNNNHFIFGFIHNVDVENGDFNPALPNVGVNYSPKKLAKTKLFYDGVQIFDGTLRLWRIVNNAGYITYEVSLFGKLFDFFGILGDTKLTDLDFSILDHEYTWANIRQTWDNSFLGGFRYPLVDYGYLDVNAGGQPATFKLGSLIPCLEYRILIDKIFSLAGASYILNFRAEDLALYNKIIVAPGKLTQLTGKPIYFKAFKDPLINQNYETQTNGIGYSLTGYINARMCTQIQENEIFNIVNGVDGYGKNTQRLEFIQDIETSFQYRLDVTTTMDHFGTGNKQTFLFYRHKAETNEEIELTRYELDILNTGDNHVIKDIEIEKTQFKTGDALYMVIAVYGSGGSGIINQTIVSIGDQCRIEAISPTDTSVYPISTGDPYIMSNSVPEGITCVEFIKDFIKLFNLYVTQDPENPNIITFTPYPNFYETYLGNAIEWTKKVDRAGEMVFTPVANLTAKNYVFTWKSDKDYWNDQYFKANGEIYGQITFIADTDIINNTEKVEMLFSPSVMQRFENSLVVCPAIYNVEIIDHVSTKKPGKFNPRLLLWGGLQPAGHDIYLLDELGNYALNGAGQTDYLIGVYPYAGHLDNPTAPTFDLNFSNTNTTLPTASDNTFFRYWYKSIKAATDKDGKLVSCYMLLRNTDIAKLDFAALYRINDQLFRLNKIEGFNPFVYDTCKVELIKIINL